MLLCLFFFLYEIALNIMCAIQFENCDSRFGTLYYTLSTFKGILKSKRAFQTKMKIYLFHKAFNPINIQKKLQYCY